MSYGVWHSGGKKKAMNTDADLKIGDEDLKVDGKPREGDFLVEDVEPWGEPVDGDLLLQELARTLRRFVVLPKWGAEALALWVVHTYAYDLRGVSAYMGLESPEKRCGKTTLLSVLSELVNRPVVAANISSPAFFRVIEETRPTLLIDEADTWLQGNEMLKGILNSGYTRKTAFVVRVAQWARKGDTKGEADAGGRMRLARYSCWCPKVMASIGRLPDTLADRCILIRMQRKAAGDECERLRDLEGLALRRQCARFVLDHAKAIAQARPGLPRGLNDRAGDIWEPLLALADLAGGGWPEWARTAALELTATVQTSNPIGTLLLDIFIKFQVEKVERLATREVVEELNQLGERPWSELRQGRKITERWLAHQLRPYGVQPGTLWVDDRTVRGYSLDEIEAAVRRYARRSDLDEVLANVRSEEASSAQVEEEPAEKTGEETGQFAALLQEVLKNLRVKNSAGNQ